MVQEVVQPVAVPQVQPLVAPPEGRAGAASNDAGSGKVRASSSGADGGESCAGPTGADCRSASRHLCRRHGWRHGWPVDGDDGDLWYGCRRHGWPRNGHGVSDDGDVCADDNNDGTHTNDGRPRNDYGRTNDNHDGGTSNYVHGLWASPDGLRDGPGHVLWASSRHGYRC